MSVPGVVLGERAGPFAGCIDADLIRRYADATSDPNPLYREGATVPPIAIVTQIWDAELAGLEVAVPTEVRAPAIGGVHGEHDVHLHRPLEPGEPLETWAEGQTARPSGDNALVSIKLSTFDGRGALVVEQWWTTLFLRTACAPAGSPRPHHAFPEDARARPLGTYGIYVDHQMARRYAEVSGDFAAHHFDAEAARRSGFPGVFIHGLCTMALCTQAVVETVAGGDPRRVRRVAVRFASPTYPGNDLRVDLYDAGGGAVAFDATCAGDLVVTNGRAELAS